MGTSTSGKEVLFSTNSLFAVSAKSGQFQPCLLSKRTLDLYANIFSRSNVGTPGLCVLPGSLMGREDRSSLRSCLQNFLFRFSVYVYSQGKERE